MTQQPSHVVARVRAADDDAYDLVIAVAAGHTDHQVAARHVAQWH